jgi:hypothetical protein
MDGNTGSGETLAPAGENSIGIPITANTLKLLSCRRLVSDQRRFESFSHFRLFEPSCSVIVQPFSIAFFNNRFLSFLG